jgi:GT2 family glycosyltransferase
MKPLIGIVLLNWNNWPDTLSCLEDIKRYTYPRERLRVIVVDNNSSDESLSQLEQHNGFELITLEKNIGFAGGNNQGIQKALDQGCEYILLLNNDTSTPPNLLQPLLSIFSEKPNAGVIAPKIHYQNPQNTIWYAGGRFTSPRIIGDLVGLDEFDKGQYDKIRQVDFATGCCMLVHKKVFDRIGLLDEDFFFYHEDVDFCFRAKQAGFSVWFQPESTIIHNVSKSTADNLSNRTYLYAKARVIFFHKHIRGLKIMWVVILEIIRTTRQVFSGIIQGNFYLSASYIRGILAGIKSAYQ